MRRSDKQNYCALSLMQRSRNTMQHASVTDTHGPLIIVHSLSYLFETATCASDDSPKCFDRPLSSKGKSQSRTVDQEKPRSVSDFRHKLQSISAHCNMMENRILFGDHSVTSSGRKPSFLRSRIAPPFACMGFPLEEKPGQSSVPLVDR